jgi:hypothetical protein
MNRFRSRSLHLWLARDVRRELASPRPERR